MEEKIQLDVRDLILQKIKDEERNLRWLSRKIEVPYNTMYGIFKHRTANISQDKLDRVNAVLGTNFQK